MSTTYACCDHCADDPGYHQDNPADSHDTWCTIVDCRDGKRAISTSERSES